MEKSREQRQNLHIAFIDFTKAFDCVNRDLLFTILQKLGCPSKLTRVIKALHTNVQARLIIDGELSEPIRYNSGVKQGCKLAPTLFGIYAAVLLFLAFKNVGDSHSIKICFRYDGNIFDLKRLKAKTKTSISYIREAQYADDIAIFCNNANSLQCLLHSYNALAQKMGLRINTKKTETMSTQEQADFYVNGEKLTKVEHFKYLGSYVSNDCNLDKEITVRIQAGSCAMGRLRDRVFNCRELTTETKLKVYNQCVIPVMVYGSETWTLYRYQVNKLRTIQQRHLRSILKIKWDDFITNDEVLDRAMTEDIENILIRNRLRWFGHVIRLPDVRPNKALLYGELSEGSRKIGRPLLRFKDTIKDILKRGNALQIWNTAVHERLGWRKCIYDISKKIDIERKEENKKKRAKRHERRNAKEKNTNSRSN